MPLNRLLGLVALAAAGCAHSIDVFVPPSDVPPRADVVAAVKTGEVQTFDHAAHLDAHGALTTDGRVVGRVAKDDIVVVRASAGDRFGSVRVERAASGELLTLLGIVVTVGGTVASLVAAGQCEAGQGSANSFGIANTTCLAGGLIGTGISFAMGVPLIAIGIGGPLVVIDSGVRVSVGPAGLRMTF